MKKELKRAIIYQIFVRNYTKEGNLQGVISHLEEIEKIGATILYLMPIFPIGKEGRKGSVGSPYAIQDYMSIDPSQGSEKDLSLLCQKAHERNMSVILDMVFNHTSRDSLLSKEHPEYFYHNKEGKFANKIGDWDDVIDLDHSHPELEEYLLQVLEKYISLGVDGFRFDVASLIPASFFVQARERIGKDKILLAECIDSGFVLWARDLGFHSLSNQELISSGFDLLYSYASFHYMRLFLESKNPIYLEQYKAAYEVEMATISQDALIARGLENHDKKRLASYSKEESFTRSLLLFDLLCYGPSFVYAGMEYKASHLPALFEKDVISHEIVDASYYEYYLKLISLKKRDLTLSQRTSLLLESPLSTLLMKNTYEEKEEYALCNFSGKEVTFSLKNGTYIDLLSDERFQIKNGSFKTKEPRYLSLEAIDN